MIIWLASYPKSGNTWLRSIISSLLYTDSGEFRIDSLKKMEDEGIFKENVINYVTNKKVNFFNQGPKNKWENFLDTKIKEELEVKFKNEMKELNYS